MATRKYREKILQFPKVHTLAIVSWICICLRGTDSFRKVLWLMLLVATLVPLPFLPRFLTWLPASARTCIHSIHSLPEGFVSINWDNPTDGITPRPTELPKWVELQPLAVVSSFLRHFRWAPFSFWLTSQLPWWNFLHNSNKLFALKFLSRGLLLGDSKLRQIISPPWSLWTPFAPSAVFWVNASVSPLWLRKLNSTTSIYSWLMLSASCLPGVFTTQGHLVHIPRMTLGPPIFTFISISDATKSLYWAQGARMDWWHAHKWCIRKDIQRVYLQDPQPFNSVLACHRFVIFKLADWQSQRHGWCLLLVKFKREM